MHCTVALPVSSGRLAIIFDEEACMAGTSPGSPLFFHLSEQVSWPIAYLLSPRKLQTSLREITATHHRSNL
ncbi:hypothetical protein AN958_01719 [Leucoagaricus sp. SymC.cos]|nr:hypothetical protein AN958_01719 [Leucoagaricus sp. SymC.cos]